MGDVQLALSTPLVAILEAFLAMFFLLAPCAALVYWLSYHQTQAEAPPPKQAAWNSEAMEQFPYSLGNLARVLKNEAGSVSPASSAAETRPIDQDSRMCHNSRRL